jgi:SAM-dependent methyltransferase
MNEQPKLYSSLAEWFHLLTRPEDYAEEAQIYHREILCASSVTPRTLLELGCGGGNNASHMKEHFHLTLTDISPDMLSLSRSINPECEHLLGDMRTLRLGRVFDVVFIHDAVGYLTSLADLSQAIETAWIHCRPGGFALFAPDAYLLRDEGGDVRVESDRHRMGLFSRSQWLDAIRRVGFEARAIPFEHSEVEPGTMELFLGVRPG